MTQEDKELLLKDLSARLPYSTLCFCKWAKDAPNGTSGCVDEVSTYLLEELVIINNPKYECQICEIKPYLRPMSSMTEEEKEELHKLHFSIRYEDWLNRHAKLVNYTYEDPIIRSYPNQKDYIAHDVNETTCANLIDWLNKHHFDYRGLIKLGLALEAPEGMYNTK